MECIYAVRLNKNNTGNTKDGLNQLRYEILSLHSKHSWKLLRPNNLQSTGRIDKVIRIRLRYKFALCRLLYKILIPLLIRESDRILLAIEFQIRALYEIGRRLPPHQIVLPPMAFR